MRDGGPKWWRFSNKLCCRLGAVLGLTMWSEGASAFAATDGGGGNVVGLEVELLFRAIDESFVKLVCPASQQRHIF